MTGGGRSGGNGKTGRRRYKGARGEEDRGRGLNLEVTVSEITHASCLKFFSVSAIFLCSLTSVMPRLFLAPF